jgi:hypothetical protein
MGPLESCASCASGCAVRAILAVSRKKSNPGSGFLHVKPPATREVSFWVRVRHNPNPV